MAVKVNKETRSTSAKKFVCHPDFGNKTSLCRGIIESVTVKTYKPKEDSKQTSFEGLAVPRLEITYIQKKENDGGYYKQSFNTIEFKDIFQAEAGTDKNGNKFERGDTTWMINSILSWVKHIAEAVTGKPFDKEFSITDAKGKDIDVEKHLDGKATCDAFMKFFTDVANYFNGGTAKGAVPIYKDKVLWIKMLMADKNGNINKQGTAALPSFVPSNGALELVVEGSRPYMSILLGKGESVVARQISSKPNASASPIQATDASPEW